MMPREILTVILLILLIVCAIAVNIIPNLLQSVIIFMAYSSIMSVVWILMESPDLGITEAAVGAGVSGILFLMTLKKVRQEDEKDPADVKEEMRRQIQRLSEQDSMQDSRQDIAWDPRQDSVQADRARDPEQGDLLNGIGKALDKAPGAAKDKGPDDALGAAPENSPKEGHTS